MIDFECPHCHETLKIPEQYLGSRGTCKRCGKQITVLVAPPPVPRTSLEVASVSPSPVPSIDSTSFPRDVSRRSLEAWVKEQVGAGVPRQHLFEFLGRK